MFALHSAHSLGLPSGLGVVSPLVFGYLDPGTGSLLFQMLIAGLLSGAYVLRSSLWSLRKFIARGLSKN